ncbi:outer membrane protein [Telluribacter humicola]|uniref:outer membrane protein n=1 Tax=Telluribacter humicola TaxID=1720261 RepID=UPI001A96FCC4|nr:outer membrane beta-barrel protein [Telluribacter humicola]
MTPQLGYLIANRLVAGFQLSYGKDSFNYKNNSPQLPSVPGHQYHSIAPELYSRYYLTGYRVKPFVQISAGYNWQKELVDTTTGEEVSSSSNNFIGAGGIGLGYMLTRSVAIEGLYNYRFFTKSRIIDANEDLKFRLGVSVFLR